MSADEKAAAAYAAGFVDDTARAEYYRLAVGCFLVAFMNAHSTLLAVVFARNGHDLHSIGVLISSMAVPVILFALLSGEIAARITVLWTLRLAMALTFIGFVSFALTSASFSGALASRIVQGMGQGLFLSSAITYAQSRLSPTRFLFLLGVFSATMPLAQAVAPPFGEFVLNHWGDQAMFLIAAAPSLVGMALTMGLRPIARPPERRGLDLFSSWRPQLIEPLLAVLVNGALFGFTTAYLAPALEARAIPIATFFTASTATMFASRALALRRIEQINRRFLVAGGLMLMSVGFVAVAFAGEQAWPVAAGGILFGFGYSATYPVLSAWMSEGVEMSRRAGPQALLNAFFNFGLFATPLPETWLVAGFGYDRTMIMLAGVCSAFALFLWIRGLRAG